MKKVVVIVLIILLGTSIVILNSMNGSTETSFEKVQVPNKNLAMPNLENATYIGAGTYRLYDNYGIILDYNEYNGIYTLNGTNTNTSEVEIRFMDFNYSGTYTMSYEYISGTYTGINLSINTAPYSGERLSKAINEVNGNVTGTNDYIRVFIYLGTAQRTYENYQFKLQLEQGDKATQYVVPKLISLYQDNLTLQQKREIGLGAFTGLTNIINTINGFTETVQNLFNNVINFFKGIVEFFGFG